MKKTKIILALLSLFLTTIYAQDNNLDIKVEALLAQMTLEEKIGQMNQYTSFHNFTGPPPVEGNSKTKYDHIKQGLVGSMLNVRGAIEVRAFQKIAIEETRLGIPLIFGFDVIHGHKTIMPIPLAEAASWDLEMIEKSARVSAIEASAEGINWTFGPMVDISRDARWGRVMEGAGEDAYLGSKIAVARVRGFQGSDLSANNTIAACAKHFAAYGFAEAGRDYNTVDIGLSTLYNVVLPPFKAAAEAGVRTFMNSFNELNGVPATGDAFLQRKILKGDWNFQGFIVSDWASIGEMVPHGHAADGLHAAELAVRAGSDMDMESHLYVHHLKELVETRQVDISKIEDAARRILKVKFELGLFDDPYKYCSEEREKELIYHADHMKTALEMAQRSIVLLKNEQNLLPLPKSGIKIALIGPLADEKNSPLGSWRLAAKDHSAVSVLEALKEIKTNTINFSKGVHLYTGETNFYSAVDINRTDKSGLDGAIKNARNADVVVMVLGEHGYQTGEGRSRAQIGLPGMQQELLEAVYAVNQNVVLVLMSGRPLSITWADEHIPAILEAWHLGTQSGLAIADVLYGDYNPSGKLPMTFPRHSGQVPIYYNQKNTGRPGPSGGVFWSHYTDGSHTPLYAFGHGLSYTQFEYSQLKIYSNKNEVTVDVTVTNTGERVGEEVAQLYLRDRVASITRPTKELKGFKKFKLNPGESKTVRFVLSDPELGFYNNQGDFVVEPGDFDIMVGGSSTNGIKDSFTLYEIENGSN
jgi:beta-glucosidase